MRSVLLALLLLSLTPPAFGAERSVAGLTADQAKLNLAAVQHQQTFVQSERHGTDLRVGLVVLDAGGSTDVSPKAGLYLTMFNEAEMKNAAALHFLGAINELVSATRVEAGVYEFVVKRYDLDGSLGGGEPTVALRVDARQASVDVRNMKGVEEFDTGQILTPVTVVESPR